MAELMEGEGVTWPVDAPADWAELNADPVMTNLDHTINEDVAALLRDRDLVSRHAAWDFNGIVWFERGHWHERVSVYHVWQTTLHALTLPELMKVVNDRFGWR